MSRTLLVPDQDVTNLLRIQQRIVDRQDRAAGNAEDHLDAEFLERPDHGLGTADALGCHGVLAYRPQVSCRG
ncbi:hypothetical protein GCM10022238_07450 [Gordonia hankookensis]